ncbi:MAG: FAD-dependent oxidoreductase [Patescibacteria group bacterium]|nr:FAD-dependent oxidoreductase [Patescibacteria group bacterium]
MKKSQLIIIGSGPAGYAAAIYTARAAIQTQMFIGEEAGGQLMYTTEVENYPGFPQGILGSKLMTDMQAQAEKFGTQIERQFVTAVDFSNRPFCIWTQAPEGVTAHQLVKLPHSEYLKQVEKIKQLAPAVESESVLITTGATSIMLGVPGEKEFLGRGVSTCAVCDAAFFKDKTTFVVGGGNAALEDALALAKFASSVTIVHRRDQFRASQIMQDRVLKNEKIKVLWNTSLEEIKGEQTVKAIVIKQVNGLQTLPADGVFIAVGHRPMTSIFHDQVELDSHGYITTRFSLTQAGLEQAGQHLSDQGLIQYPSMTSVEGVFAAGDVVDVRYKQAITAAGQGCQAGLDAQWWLESQV